MRISKKENSLKEVDLAVPIDKSKIKADPEGCFGNEWDMSSRECPVCAMNDICGILYQDIVNAKIKKISNPDKPFLDETDFEAIDQEALFEWCQKQDGTLPTMDLVNEIMKQAKTMDDVAAVEFVKTFKAKYNLKFRSGIVWLK